VSAAGSNSNNGLSPSAPWRDLTPVNATALAPGNTILFRGGDTFTGRIYVDGTSLPAGTATITFGSYGRGRAALTNTSDCAFYAYNPTCGIRIRRLRFVGPGPSVARIAGVLLYRDLPGRSRDVRIHGCQAVGWTDGVSIGGWSGGGFDDVRVTNCSLSDNRDTGLAVFGAEFDSAAPAYANTNVYVGSCQAFNQKGNPRSARNSGSGFVLGSVDGGMVEGCTAYGNGSLCAAPEGPVGIWAYDSNRVTFQSNASYSNETGGAADGGGFDLDINCSNCTVQYNLAYGNAGPGVLLFSGANNEAHTGNVVRYNLLWGNAINNYSYGEVLVAGSVRSAEIYNNTMVAGQAGTVKSAAVAIWEGPSDVHLSNNILLATGTGPIVMSRAASSTSAVLFQGNSYHSTGAFSIAWGGTEISTVEAWTQATGQELVSGVASAVSGDPQLVNAAVSPTPVDANGMKLQIGSPLQAAGLDLVDCGPHDYFGTALSSPVSIGGHEL